MATTEQALERIEQRLDLIAYLLLLSLDRSHAPQVTDLIATLADRGMSPAEIGRIVGRKANYVSVMTKRNKKRVLK